MMESTDTNIRIDERKILTSKLKRGQLLENSPRVREALEIWDGIAQEVSGLVKESRELLQLEIERLKEGSTQTSSENHSFSEIDSDDGKIEE